MGVYRGIAEDNVLITSGRATLNSLTVSGNVTVTGNVLGTAPVTKTANFAVAATENYIVCDGAGSISVTLPTPASSVGRVLFIKTIAAQTVVSDASNVQPIGSATPGTAILAASAGAWAMLVCNGTNWIVMGS